MPALFLLAQEGQGAGSSNSEVLLRHTQSGALQSELQTGPQTQQQQQQQHNGMHSNADCASSTRDAAAAAVTVPSLADHLQVGCVFVFVCLCVCVCVCVCVCASN